MRFLAFLLTFAFVSTAIVALAPTASATHDACRVEDVEGQPRCLVDFARNERCIYNPLAYVLPDEPTYIC